MVERAEVADGSRSGEEMVGQTVKPWLADFDHCIRRDVESESRGGYCC